MTTVSRSQATRRRGIASIALLVTGMVGLAFSGSISSAAYTDAGFAHSEALTAQIDVPFQTGLNSARSVDTAAGVGTDGNAYVWGRTDMKMAGTVPGGTWQGATKVGGLPEGEITAVSGQIYGFNGLQRSGEVWGWGYHPARDGTGTARPDNRPERIRIGTAWNGGGPVLENIALISTTEMAGAGVREDGTVWAWGARTYGGLGGSGATQVPGLPDPLANGGERFPVYISGGYTTFWIILNNGEVWYWGGDSSAPRADGTSYDRARMSTALAPWFRTAVGPGDGSVVRVVGGIDIGLAVLSNGRVLTWGGSDRVGNRPTPPDSRDPGLVSESVLSNIENAVSGFTGALLLDRAGNLYGYGASDDYGKNPRTPTLMGTNVTHMAAGQGYYIWRTSNGEYWGQGYNPQGVTGTPRGNGLRQITLDLGILN